MHCYDHLSKNIRKGDSVHSTVEREMRNRPIYVPTNYVDIMITARSAKPYDVKYVDNEYFKELSSETMYNSIRPGVKVGDKCVTDLRVLKYCPDGTLQYKTICSESEYQDFPRMSNYEWRCCCPL